MLSDVMNINKRPLIVFMTGPWEWGLEKMRLKRPCRSFLKGVTLLDPDGKEVGSCSGSSDSLCVCFKIWLLGCTNSQHLPQPSLWRPRVGVDENVSPHGADLISRQPPLPYSSGLLFALLVTCISAHAQLLGRPGSGCRVQTSFPGVPRVGAGWYGCCSPTTSLWSSYKDRQDVGGAAATATRLGRLRFGVGASSGPGSLRPAAMVPPRHQQPPLLPNQLPYLLRPWSRFGRVREGGRRRLAGDAHCHGGWARGIFRGMQDLEGRIQ